MPTGMSIGAIPDEMLSISGTAFAGIIGVNMCKTIFVTGAATGFGRGVALRSEERRVGKECRL